jgi:acyl-CoA thioesterase I
VTSRPNLPTSIGSLRYVSLGDSSGVGIGAGGDGGYPARLAKRLRQLGVDVKHTNEAESGATSDDVVRSQLAWTQRLGNTIANGVDVVTLGIGGNDLWRLVPPSRFGENLDTIAAAIAPTGAVLVVANVIDMSLAPAASLAERMLGIGQAMIRARVVEMNREVATLGEEHDHVRVVDLYSFSQREIPLHPEYFASDGFHPSKDGYDRWADLMWPELERLAQSKMARVA